MKQAPYGSIDLKKDLGLDKPTLDRLELYAEMLREWTPRINLVAKSTLPDLWRRHFLDAAQLYELIPSGTASLADLGSGAGFPGLILAILGVPDVHLFESDQRKAVFLKEVARATETPLTVRAERLEQAESRVFDVITARAFAPLEKLLTLSTNLRGSKTTLLLLKGQNVVSELTDAHKIWTMMVSQRPSRSDPQGTILQLTEVYRDTDRDDSKQQNTPHSGGVEPKGRGG